MEVDPAGQQRATTLASWALETMRPVEDRDRAPAEDPHQLVAVDLLTIAAVSSSTPMPSSCGRLRDDHQQPSVAVALVEVLVDDRGFEQPEPGRHLGHPLLGGGAAGPPKATMCEDWMLAPAEVPATTAPRSVRLEDRVADGVPQIDRRTA